MNLRTAAHHEAAHAVVAEALGYGAARVELWREGRDGSAWVRGRVSYLRPETDREQRLISLAGAVGEVLSGPAASNWGPALVDPICSAISATDAIGAGMFSNSDVDQCIRVVKTLWPTIEARAALEMDLFHKREAAGAAASA